MRLDPDANLVDQRRIAIAIAGGTRSYYDAERLAELVLALDTWLVNGGFPPKGWTR